jgi:hypothetical protein
VLLCCLLDGAEHLEKLRTSEFKAAYREAFGRHEHHFERFLTKCSTHVQAVRLRQAVAEAEAVRLRQAEAGQAEAVPVVPAKPPRKAAAAPAKGAAVKRRRKSAKASKPSGPALSQHVAAVRAGDVGAYFAVYNNARYVQVFWPINESVPAIKLTENRQMTVPFVLDGDAGPSARKKLTPVSLQQAQDIARKLVELFANGHSKEDVMSNRAMLMATAA